MKNKATLSLATMVLGLLLFFSCNNTEEDGPQILNQMTVDTEVYELGGGILVNWQETHNGSADYDLALFTPGVTINEEGMPENPGTLLYFDLNSYAADGFEGGTFTFGQERAPGVIMGAFLVLEYDGNPLVMPTASYMSEGSLTVGVDGDIYQISFNAVTKDGNVIEGQYVGELIQQLND